MLAGLADWNKDKINLFLEQLYYLQREENEILDMKKLQNKQLYVRQLMNLKSKGRYLDETLFYVETMKVAPSL
jgi:hypothetical protein